MAAASGGSGGAGIFSGLWSAVADSVAAGWQGVSNIVASRENTWVARTQGRADNVDSMTGGVVFIGVASVLVMVVLIVIIAKSE